MAWLRLGLIESSQHDNPKRRSTGFVSHNGCKYECREDASSVKCAEIAAVVHRRVGKLLTLDLGWSKAKSLILGTHLSIHGYYHGPGGPEVGQA